MTTFTDDFNRADNASVGSNWTTMTGFNGHRIVSNQAAGPNSGEGAQYVATSAATFAADQEAQANISGMSSGSGTYCGIVLRASGGNGYVAFTNGVGGAGQTAIGKWVGGSLTELKAISTTFADGDVLKFKASGTSSTLLEFYKNGSLVDSYTDSSSPITSGQPGMESFGSAARLDNFSATDGVSGGGATLGSANGIALASISQFNGIAKASVASKNGLTTS